MLTILAFVAIIIAAYYAYKTARDNGRNGIVWALITFAIGFGLQFVLPVLIGIVLALIWMASGDTQAQMQSKIQGPAQLIGIVAIILSFVGMGFILRFVSTVPDGVELPLPTPSPNSIFRDGD